VRPALRFLGQLVPPRSFGAWLVALVLVTTVSCGAAAANPELFLEIDLAVERGTTTGVLFDFGDGIWGENSSVATVPPGSTPTTVRLPLPHRPIRALRFDPVADDQSALITGMRLADAQGHILRTLDVRGLRPMHQIEAIVTEAGGVRIRPTPKADDPMLRIDLGPLQQGMHQANGWRTVTRPAVALLAGLLVALVAVALFAAVKAAGATPPWIAGAGIFCLVFGGRLVALNLYSRAVPFWDEWEGDAAYILIPLTGGFLDWNALVMPQWEHRILLTRVVTLFGTLLNGEWDPRVAMTVSAAMFAATIALIGLLLMATRQRAMLVAALLLAVAAAAPYDFNNVLWGGQTQMYGLILCAIVTLAIAATPEVMPLTYAGAAAAGLVSLFTMGAGPVGPGCAVGICLVRAWQEPDQRRRLLALAAVFFAVALAGVALHVSSRAHVGFYATSFAQFWRAFIGVCAWPLPPAAIVAALVWLPWVVHGWHFLRRGRGTPLDWLAVGVGGWALINAAALGYARQYEGPPFDSRFFTSLSLGGWAAVLSAAAALSRAPGWRRAWWPAATMAALAAGFFSYGVAGIRGAQASRVDREDREQRVRTFLATGNRTAVMEKPTHANGEPVLDRLESPLLQQVLPAAFRRELAKRAGHEAFAAAQPGAVTTFVRTLMKLGWLILVLGVAGLGSHLILTCRPRGLEGTGRTSDV
jgi:hypothetical protein